MTFPTRPGVWLAAPPPAVAVEVASRRVTVAGLARTGAGWIVASHATELLPDDAVRPALTGTNIADPSAVARALGRALDRAGLRSARRAALIVPDSTARVSLITFEQVPSERADLEQLIRWQLRKSAPFPVEDARISLAEAHATDGATTLAAAAARREVIAEYEAVADAAGLHAGIVDLGSFNVINALISAGASVAADWLLVHLAPEATTLAIMRGDALMFYRHRLAGDQEPLGALIHQTAMYHEDRLGGTGFARVWLSGATLSLAEAGEVRRSVGERLGMPIEAVDIRRAVSIADGADASPSALDSLAAPVGVLLREQAA
jgi:type IV pilus assembly protein PilM